MHEEKTKLCSTCGTENGIDVLSCRVCGRRLEQPIAVSVFTEKVNKRCPGCGAMNNPFLLACQKCGRTLNDIPVMQSPSIMSKVASIQPASIQPKALALTAPKSRRVERLPVILVVIILIMFVLVLFLTNELPVPSHATSSLSLPTSLGTIPWHDEILGVNDGSFPPFDIGRNPQEVTLKQQAAQQLKAHSSQAAIALWQEALSVESNDAEALIYIENQRVLASGKPFITLVAAVSFTAPFPDQQYETQLQGIYVAQHEHNNSASPLALRILIANSGSDINNVSAIAQQIVRVAHQDKTVVGVIGWQASSHCQDALPVLSAAGLPLISPQASSDFLTGISPYFFRIVPPNKVEAQEAALFAENTLHITHPVIFLDPKDLYSQNLAQDFIDQFTKDGHADLHKEVFVTDKNSNFSALLQDAEQYQPDAFIFTSASSVDAGLFQDALPTSGPFAQLPTVAGDGSYIAHPNSHGRWYFAEFAYHGEIDTPIATQFALEYSADFNTHSQKPTGYYGYTLANDSAILTYDATAVVLAALQMVYIPGKSLTPQNLADALPRISGANAFQGVSGQISFGADHDPINKTVIILFVSPKGFIQLQSIQGCSLTTCSTSG